MPRTVTVDGLKIADGTSSSDFKGIYLLGNIVSEWTNEEFEKKMYGEGYPYIVPESVTVSGYESEQGCPYALSSNTYMYRNTALIEK